MKKIILSLIISVFTFGFVVTAKAEGNCAFVVFETTVTRAGIETGSENPEERRFYVSNVVEYPDELRSYQVSKLVDKYFTANVVEPLKAKGVGIDYYDDGVQLDCDSVLAPKDKQDAEAKRAACIEEIKERSSRVNIYSFYWTFGAAKGLATTNPTLIFRGKDTPNYQPRSR